MSKTNLKSIDQEQLLSIMKGRFPQEYEMCLQQAYIENLEAALAETNQDANELSE